MENSISEGKGRLGWFDAMRGLAIILVVLGHVLHFGIGLGGTDYSSVLYSIIASFHVPLLFFISGFFAYKVCERWTPALVGDVGKRRFQALVVCTLVFFVLRLYCRGGENFLAWLHSGFLGGYWFTFVLFQMFVVFLALSLLSKLFKSERILVVGLILVSIVGWEMLRLKPYFGDSLLWGVLCTGNFCTYFQFFAFGIFCRKYQALFETVLSKNWFNAGITICAVAFLILQFQDGLEDFYGCIPSFIHILGVRYALLLVVVAFFFTKRKFFETQNATSSVFRYVGRRTLDIYMIHWFFLPDLGVLREWLLPGNMFIVQLAIGLVVSALIIAVCLLLSEILRMSDFLSAWLFGVKPRRLRPPQ